MPQRPLFGSGFARSCVPLQAQGLSFFAPFRVLRQRRMLCRSGLPCHNKGDCMSVLVSFLPILAPQQRGGCWTATMCHTSTEPVVLRGVVSPGVAAGHSGDRCK